MSQWVVIVEGYDQTRAFGPFRSMKKAGEVDAALTHYLYEELHEDMGEMAVHRVPLTRWEGIDAYARE